jgi:hypothetical protein
MSYTAKTLLEAVTLTEAEISAVAGGTPPTDITPSSGIVTIAPNLPGGDLTLGAVVESKKKKTVTQPFLTITIDQAIIT